MSSRCRSCGAAIIWAVTGVARRAMPLDAEPTEEGNILLRDGVAVVATRADNTEGELMYLSHFATCPEAKRHRVKGKKAAVGGRTCPFDGCGKQIADAMFSCYEHWFRLGKDQRAVVSTAYSDYLANKIGVEELRVIQQRVLDEVQKPERNV